MSKEKKVSILMTNLRIILAMKRTKGKILRAINIVYMTLILLIHFSFQSDMITIDFDDMHGSNLTFHLRFDKQNKQYALKISNRSL